MADEQIRLDVTAKDTASRVVDDVADRVEDLERADPTVDVDADARPARRALDDVETAARDLDGRDVNVDVRVEVDDARRKLADVETTADRSGGAAGGKFGASFARDVGAPIGGGAENVIGDLADAFATAGETIGGAFGGRMGKAISGVGTVAATAFGVGGLAYLAVKGLWDLWDSRADAAKKKLEDIQATQLLFASGRTVEAVRKLWEQYGDAIDNARELGATTEDATRFILGASKAIGRYGDDLKITGDDLADTMELQRRFTDLTFEEAQALADLLQPLYKARREYDAAGTSLEDLQREQFAVLKGSGAVREAFLKMAEEALPAVRDEILRYVGAQERIPASVTTSILLDADPNDVEQMRRAIEARAAGTPVRVPVKLDVDPNVTGPAFDAAVDAAVRKWARRNGGRAWE